MALPRAGLHGKSAKEVCTARGMSRYGLENSEWLWAQQVFIACVSLCVLHAQADTVPFCFLSPRVLCLSADKHNNNNTTTVCHEAAVPGTNELLSSGNLGSTTLPQGARQHEKPQLSGHPDAKRRRTGRHAAKPDVAFAPFNTEYQHNGVVRAVAAPTRGVQGGAVTTPPRSHQGAAMLPPGGCHGAAMTPPLNHQGAAMGLPRATVGRGCR